MSDGSVRPSAGTVVRGVYLNQGAVTPGSPLKTFTIPDTDAAEINPIAFGTGSGRMDRITISDRPIAAGASVTYDLFTGSDLLDQAGGTCAFRTLRFWKVTIITAAGTSGVRVGGAASNEQLGWFVAAGDKQDIFPGGPPFQQGSPAGKAVSSTTANLKIENLSTTAQIVVRVIATGSIQEAGYATGMIGGPTYP